MDFNPIDLILHLDVYLDMLVTNYGPWIYAILFLVIFCETGLVVTPFLPGDSLLFIAGAVAAGGGMDPVLLGGLLMLAAILGDSTNYVIGRTAGERLFRNPKINLIWDSAVEEVLGSGDPIGVSGVRIRNLKTNETREIACDGLFVAIGHMPSTELFKGKLPLDGEGYLVTKADSTATNIPGVFAAGDVKDKVFRQAVTAAGMGCMAALEAERFLAANEHGEAKAAE